MVTATPLLSAPTPAPVVICTDKRDPCVTVTLPVAIPTQLGVVSSLGPVMVADIPVLVGSSNPHGLVKMVAVTVESGIVLSLIFNTRLVIIAFCGTTTVLVANNGSDEEVPSPIHPPSLTD